MICRRISAITFLLTTALSVCAQVDNQVPTAQPTPPATPSASPAPTATPSSTPPDSTRLEVVSAPRPVYPREAAEKELQGEVWVKLLISETGEVETTETVSGNPILAKAAAAAMLKWKFKPFIKNGKAVKVSTKMPFDFAVEGHVSDPHRPPAPDLAVAPVSPTKTEVGSSGATSPTPTATADRLPMKLRVSEGVMDSNIVHRVEPVYPPEAKRNHIQGTVLLQATIGRDGRIRNLRVISGPPELVEASLGAIEQWRYRPYTLNGEPVEVETTIKVQFRM